MAKVAVVGCGTVGEVGLKKMVKFPDIFSEITVMTRTVAKAHKIKSAIWGNYPGSFNIVKVDAGDREQMIMALQKFKPDLLIHWGYPYHNLVIMEACLESGVPYIDTACFEDEKKLGFSYGPQLALNGRFVKANLFAGCGFGFDPGQSSIYCTYPIAAGILDEILTIDILDCNGGKKDAIWVPNFNPEINIRELTLPVRLWEKGEWQERGTLMDKNPIRFAFDFPDTGNYLAHLMYHEELETLVRHFPRLQRGRFWMTFDDEYLTHLRVIHNLGLDGIAPIIYEGHQIIPLRFLKAVLPKGEDFNPTYRGKVCIGCIISGLKDGKEVVIYIYTVKKHEDCYVETGGNAIGYTTAIPTVLAAILFLTGIWKGVGVKTPEEMDPMPFMGIIGNMGLPWFLVYLPDGLPTQLRKNY